MRKTINIIFTLMISVGLILLGVFIFRSSYLRLWETLQDFGRSIGYYFCEVFGIEHNLTPTVNEFTQIMDKPSILPDNFDGFKNNAALYYSDTVFYRALVLRKTPLRQAQHKAR